MASFMLICNPGNAQIKLLSNGYIGLGTTTPSTDVEIKSPNILLKSSTSTTNIRIQYLNNVNAMIEPTVNNSGYLGYNTRWYQLKVNTVNYTTLYQGSDVRIKDNIRDLKNSLDKVLKMRGVEYDLSEDYLYNPEDPHGSAILIEEGKDQIGLLAQELLPILPEAVKYDSLNDQYGINYISLIPVLIEAIKEQDKKVKELNGKLKDMESKQTSGNSEQKDAGTGLTGPNTELPSLGKNRPNPFSENTSIDYFLPASVQYATLYIYDLQGKQLKSITIAGRDYGQVIIHGSELQPGMYHYSLIADGKIVGTEQMVLTD
jgi:hypothetical protein